MRALTMIILAAALVSGCAHSSPTTARAIAHQKPSRPVAAKVVLPCPDTACPFYGQLKKCEHSEEFPW